MTRRRDRHQPSVPHPHPDYTRLPAPIDVSDLVQTHDDDPEVHVPRSLWATPDIADLVRTNAIGGI